MTTPLTQTLAPPKPPINFEELIQNFKQDYYKRVPTIYHEFLYTCIHPIDKDLVITLECNFLPSDLKIYDLKDENELVDTTRKSNLSLRKAVTKKIILDEEDVPYGFTEHSADHPLKPFKTAQPQAPLSLDQVRIGIPVQQPVEALPPNRVQDGGANDNSFIIDGLTKNKSTNPAGAQGKDSEKQGKFEFDEAVSYQLDKQEKGLDFKYSISIWKLYKGNQPLQQTEYSFNSQPYGIRFYFSNDGKHIFFFFKDTEGYIKRLIVLNSQNLEEVKALTITEKLQTTDFYDAHLLNNAKTLYIRYMNENSETENLFIDLNDGQIQWRFKEHEESKEDEENADWNILKYCFKAQDNENIYIFASSSSDPFKQKDHASNKNTEKDEDNDYGNEEHAQEDETDEGLTFAYLFKIKTKSPSLISNFTQDNIVWQFKHKFSQSDFYQCSFNKNLNQLCFFEYYEDKVHVINIDDNTKNANIQQITEAKQMIAQKNSFLYDKIACFYQNSFEQTIALSLSDISISKEVKNCTDDWAEWMEKNLFDVQITSAQDMVIVAQSEQSMSEVVINYYDKKDTPILNSFYEISEKVCHFPYIFYCKGNADIYIQSINKPKQVWRLGLKEETFLSFVSLNEENERIEDSGAKQKLAYLTQLNNKIFLNVLLFDNYTDTVTFQVKKCQQYITRKDLKLGAIQKIHLLKAKKKDAKQNADIILVFQYTNTLFMKSLTSNYQYQEKAIVQDLPMQIVSTTDGADVIYYVVKDGSSMKVMKIFFGGDSSEFVQTAYEFKAYQVHMFDIQNETVYLMDDTYQIKELKYDTKTYKLESEKNFCLTEENKETLEESLKKTFTTSSQVIYNDDKAYMFYSSLAYQKTHEFMKFQHVFGEYEERQVIEGPFKVPGMNYLMYIVKSNQNYNQNEYHEDQEEQEEESEAIEEDKEEGDNQEKQSNTDSQFNVVPDEDHERNNHQNIANPSPMRTLRKRFEPVMISQPEFDEKLLQGQSTEEQSYYTEIILVPFFDDCQMQLCQETNYKNVIHSTFIDENNRILIILRNDAYSSNDAKNIFQIYSKNGNYLHKPEIIKDNTVLKEQELDEYQLLQISDNMKYLLFWDSRMHQLVTFEIISCEDPTNTNGKTKFVFKKQVDTVQTHYSRDYYLRDLGYIDNQMTVYQVLIDQATTEPDKVIQVYKCEEADQGNVVILNSATMNSGIYEAYRTEREKTQESLDVSYAFTDKYFFLKIKNEIEYYAITIDPKTNSKQISPNPTLLNLKLESFIEIKRILSTADPNLVQINFYNSECGTSCVVTWNLMNNIEHSMIELDKDENPHLIRGVKTNQNYIVTPEYFYDMEYLLPFTFFRTFDQLDYVGLSVNEKKLSSNGQLLLGSGYMNSMFTSYAMADLFYWQYMSSLKPDQWHSQNIHLDYFISKFSQNTILNQYALDNRVLQLIYEEVLKVEASDSSKTNYFKNLFFSVVFKNDKGQSPFALAVRKQSPKCIEIMLEMLIQVPDFRMSPFIREHFNDMFNMGLQVFERYLEVCSFKHISLNDSKSLKWNIDQEEDFIDFHTSYIGEEFYLKLLNYKKKDEPVKDDKKSAEPVKPAVAENPLDNQGPPADLNSPHADSNRQLIQSPHNSEIKGSIVQILDAQQPEENSEEQELKRVEFSLIEFDWIFSGKESRGFISKLANTDNDNLFAISTIKIIIMFLWKKFFVRIVLYIFLPFIVYMTFFLVYVTYIFEQRRDNPDDPTAQGLDYFFIAVVGLHILFFLALEIRQMVLNKLYYLTSFWNMLDLASLILNGAFIVIDLTEVDIQTVRPVGACCVLFMWIKLFYFLRLFQPTAAMIRMIVQICKDMSTFAAVLALAMIGFGNAFYIFSLNFLEPGAEGQDSESRYTGGNFLMALIYSFRTGLGDFSTDGYEKIYAAPFLWIIFLLCAIVIQIVLLNLLIAIMGDTYDKVTELGEQSMLKEICAMISENEFVLDRNKVFRNSKYIVVARLEKAEATNSQNWEGKISALKTYFQSMVAEQKKETKSQMDALRAEMAQSYKVIESKLSESQSNMSKQQKSLTQILNEIKAQSAITASIAKKQEEMKPVENISKKIENKFKGLNNIPEGNQPTAGPLGNAFKALGKQ